MKEKLTKLLTEYGPVAIFVYFVIFIVVFLGFVAAIKTGFAVEGVSGHAGTFGAAYIATQLTKPFRIGAALLLTPVVAKLRKKNPSSATTPPPPE